MKNKVSAKKIKTIMTITTILFIIVYVTNYDLANKIVGILCWLFCGFVLIMIACHFLIKLKYKMKIEPSDRNILKEFKRKGYSNKQLVVCIKNKDNKENTDHLSTHEILDEYREVCENILKGTKVLFTEKSDLNNNIKELENYIKKYNVEFLQEAPNDIKILLKTIDKYYDDDGKFIE